MGTAEGSITIDIKCKGAGLMSILSMNPLQGSFKVLTPENLLRLKREIMTDGFIEPISIWEGPDAKVYILNGHQRYYALTDLRDKGWVDDDGKKWEVKVPQVPVNYVEADSIEDAKRKILSLASQYGSVSTQGLKALIEELGLSSEQAFAQFNFPEVDLSSLMAGLAAPIVIGQDFEMNPLLGEIKQKPVVPDDPPDDRIDEVPEPPKNPKTRIGDIYQLGDHRLMCGDSTDKETVLVLTGGIKAEMLFTDPPYGVNYQGGHFHSGDVNIKRKREKLANDMTSEIYSRVMPVIPHVVDGPCYTWFAFTQCRPTVEAIEAIGEMHALIIWHKTNATYAAMNAQYKQRHEPCIYWKPKGSTLRWVGPTDECTIWEIKRDGRNEFHPTQKPVELAERAILNHKAETVLDLFGGSGSTLIACEKTKRKCFMMELDPSYCDVIVERWETFSGKKAKKIVSAAAEGVVRRSKP